MEIKLIYCPKCGNTVMKSYPNKKIKLRTNILIFEPSKTICKCMKCHAEIEVPIQLEINFKEK